MEFTDKDFISVYFSGSPENGFQAYPPEYLYSVKKSDNSSKDSGIVSEYGKTENKVTISYIQYGILESIDGSKGRGGRNFGIWIELIGYELTKKGGNLIYSFLEETFNNIKLYDNIKIIEEYDSTIYYVLSSFSQEKGMLDPVLEKIKKEFLSTFTIGSYLLPIKNQKSSFTKDLVPPPLPPKEPEKIENVPAPTPPLLKVPGNKEHTTVSNPLKKALSNLRKQLVVTWILIGLLFLFNGLLLYKVYSVSGSNSDTTQTSDISSSDEKNTHGDSKAHSLNTPTQSQRAKLRIAILKKISNKSNAIDYDSGTGAVLLNRNSFIFDVNTKNLKINNIDDLCTIIVQFVTHYSELDEKTNMNEALLAQYIKDTNDLSNSIQLIQIVKKKSPGTPISLKVNKNIIPKKLILYK